MTSINNLMSTSSATSIYGNRNVISGLASGMDTEQMIENAISGYKTKITGLQQKQEQVQWKQEAYRSIIDKMVNLTRKYTSYTSSTNLLSQSFFNKAVTSVTNGANKDLISAIGKTSSDVQINGVKQLAQAARRSMNVSATALADAMAQTNDYGRLQLDGGKLDLSGNMDVSNIAGGMSITYGGSSVYLNFSDLDVFKSDTYDSVEAGETPKSAKEKLVDAINQKLGEGQVKAGNGSYVTASDRILAKIDDETGNIVFEDKSGAGNAIYISSATKEMQTALGFTAGEKATSMKVNENLLSREVKKTEYLSNKTVSFNLDGVTKNISLGDLKDGATVEDIKETLQKGLNKQFGDGKVQVGVKDGGLTFDIANGSTLQVTSEVSEALGLGKSGMTSYLDASKTLKDLGMDSLFDGSSTQEATVNMSDLIKLSKEKINVNVNGKDYEIDLGEVKYTTTAAEMAEKINEKLKDSGVSVSADKNGKLNFVGEADKKFEISSSNTEKADIFTKSTKMQELTVNGTSVGKFSEDSTLTSVINAINNADTGIKLSYSKMTNEFSMVAKDTGEQGEVKMEGKLAEMFGFGGKEDKFSQFENDELTLLQDVLAKRGIEAASDKTVRTPDNGNAYFKNADGVDVARKIIGADGSAYLQVRNDDGSWDNVYRLTTKDGYKLAQEWKPEGGWSTFYQEVAGKNGSVNIQKKTGVDDAGNDIWQTIGNHTKGQDAIFSATVNGKQMTLTRSSNTVDMDGMSVTLKGTFGEDAFDKKVDDKGKVSYSFNSEKAKDVEPVTFTTSADVDTIKDAIKSFVEDYNAMVKEIHDAYSTQPNEKSSKDHTRYLPLTEEDKKDMSESAIAAYEEKAKQGLLFGSSDLSNLYRQLTSTIQNSSLESSALKKIGITTSYSDGLTTLELDENALTDALKNDPDSVRDTFARSVENGSSSDGLMYNLKSVMDTYAGTSSGSMGLLIQQAGSIYSPTSINSNNLQKQYDDFTTQIEKWQTKMSDKVDYYTRQFTALEQLIAQMNNQSSMLSGLQGGY